MPAHWLAPLTWLTRPEDGPVLVVLALVVACGLLGGLWRRTSRGRSSEGGAEGAGPV